MMSAVFTDLRSRLRFEPVRQQVRASYGGQMVAETTEAVLVWEPHSKIPAYAVPVRAIRVPMTTAPYRAPAHLPELIGYADRGRVHGTDGRTVTLTVGTEVITDAGFIVDDPDLADLVVLRWSAFDWHEEGTPMIVHPQDPYVRISTRPSERHLVVEYRGTRLAETHRAVVLLETELPPRWYLPRDDLTPGLFVESSTVTGCPYKGWASYLSLREDRRGKDLAWYYPEPLPDAVPVAGMVSFWNERVTLLVDGEELR
ncbi:DUF427 domain-containing protein [Nocardioides marmorisolisilvae]|nr:DUF427 domain-containing protein [Nocardioides marmorisolisilvae]